MRHGVLVIAGLVIGQPLHGQTASADSAAIVALELEMSRLLAEGRVDEYATHLTSDYARTTRDGKLERRDAALASWRARGAAGPMRPGELWVRVYGDAAVLTGVVGGADPSAPRGRITKTFVREQGQWRLAALAGSGIPQR
jgi:hypothetical protein